MQQYEVLSTIAAALYGRVDCCRHRESGEIVAVKRMELSFAGRKCAKETNRAVQEDVFAELSTNLKVQALGGHPFVLPMKDCFMEQQVVQLVLTHCAHGELLGVINTNRAALSTAHLLRYFKQVLLAMEFLHANGIAHRDVSLENVLVDDRDCCQVCDFGLATSAATMKASPVGKMHYMAPEALATGDNSNAWYNPIAADTWSLGVMLFSMLAGRYPFREPQRRDDHFRLLEDFGIAYLLEKLDVDTQSNPAIADLLAQFFVVDPVKRPSVATILRHSALVDIDCESVSTFFDSTSTSINSCCCDNQCEHEDNTPVESVTVVSQTPKTNQMSTCQVTPTAMPLQPESSSPTSLTKKSSSSRAIITPLVSTIHPTVKAPKELEVLQAELPESQPRATSSRRELISRTIHKIFRKKRDSDVAQ